MKKYLLMAGAAVLSLVATNANAVNLGASDTPLSVTINPQVDLVGTFGLAKGPELKFGVVVVPDGGFQGTESITVMPNASGTAYGNVTLLGGSLAGTTSDSAAATGTNTVSAGQLTVTGAIETLLASRPTIPATDTTAAIPGAAVRLVFEDTDSGNSAATTSIVLKSTNATPATCGTITEITLDRAVTAPGTYYYGGKLTMANTAAAGMHCVGTATVTMVFDE